MKTLLTIFLSFCFSILLFAENLVLKNGKIYHDYEVIRKDKKGIKIRYTVHDGTLHYSRTKVIPYQDLKDEDQAQFQGYKIEYKITGAKEVDIFLIPAKQKVPEFEVAEKYRYDDAEKAWWYVLFLYGLYHRDELLKKDMFEKMMNFPFRSTLLKLCECKILETAPVGEIQTVPKGKYIFVAFKKHYTDSGFRYYIFTSKMFTIDQLRTKIELEFDNNEFLQITKN